MTLGRLGGVLSFSSPGLAWGFSDESADLDGGARSGTGRDQGIWKGKMERQYRDRSCERPRNFLTRHIVYVGTPDNYGD